MKKTIVLGLFADRIDILLCAGDHVTASRRLNAELGADPAQWAQAVEKSAGPLRSAIEELHALRAVATVLYHSPTACADLSSLSLRSTSQAKQAAILGTAEALTCSIEDATCQAAVIGRDARSTGGEPQTHVVVAADHDQAVSSITTLVEAAGLQFGTATPIDSLIMARLGAKTLRSSAKCTGYLHIGENRSFFIIADHGTLLFARPINLGIEALTTSLTRPIRGAYDTAPIELPLNEARTILHEHGFPSRDAVVHQQRGLAGAQIIPLLQPILQRFIVELRQSLRFGVVEEQRQHIEITLTGPGSAIPNFARLLAAELGLKVNIDESHAAFDFREPDSCGSELMDARADRRMLARLGLQPRRIASARHVGRLRRCLLGGAAAALAVAMVDMLQVQQRLTTARQEIATMDGQITGVKSLQSTGEKLFSSIAAMDKLEAAIAKEVGATINIRACMHELSQMAPDISDPAGAIRLTLISFNLDKGKTSGRLNGFAFESPAGRSASASGPTGGRTQLEPFIERLKQSPLFDGISLANVQTSHVGAQAGQQFEVSMTAVGIPIGAPPTDGTSTPSPVVATTVGVSNTGATP